MAEIPEEKIGAIVKEVIADQKRRETHRDINAMQQRVGATMVFVSVMIPLGFTLACMVASLLAWMTSGMTSRAASHAIDVVVRIIHG